MRLPSTRKLRLPLPKWSFLTRSKFFLIVRKYSFPRLKLENSLSTVFYNCPQRNVNHNIYIRECQPTLTVIFLTSNLTTIFYSSYFPHRKLISSAERKSPRYRRTPGKKTPTRKTPGKKTPAKTPKSSTKKKAMRRLLLDENRSQSEHVTRSQPRENFIKRALFVSPENRKSVPQVPCTSVPAQAMKSRRSLFGSPITAETKSLDGSHSDQFLKRKRSIDDVGDNSRSKIAKSLSFGGDCIGTEQSATLYRRSSEVFASKNSVELNETHKKVRYMYIYLLDPALIVSMTYSAVLNNY